MEKEKYYTPKIEEFCAGFEFEMNNGYEWSLQIFPKPWWENGGMGGFNTLSNCLNDGSGVVKVKYLDREDIESLGWTKRDEPYAPSSTYLPKSSVLESYYKHKTELYITKDVDFIPPKHLMIYQLSALRGYGDEEHRSVFKGTVKNKTELKKLMEMLGIK